MSAMARRCMSTRFKLNSSRAREDNMTEAASTKAPKEASAPVVARHDATLNALRFSDTRDFADAARGFLVSVEIARITSVQGMEIWRLEPYGFRSDADSPPTFDPSLWR